MHLERDPLDAAADRKITPRRAGSIAASTRDRQCRRSVHRHLPGAPRATSPSAQLQHLGLDLDVISIDLAARRSPTPIDHCGEVSRVQTATRRDLPGDRARQTRRGFQRRSLGGLCVEVSVPVFAVLSIQSSWARRRWARIVCRTGAANSLPRKILP
jgi:hypothetical protein